MAAVPRSSALLVLWFAGLAVVGCGKRASRPPAPDPIDAAPIEVAVDAGVDAEEHGARWREDEEGERMPGFQIFKEAWVYVDGEPVGVLREVELPEIPVAWTNATEFLDFSPGDPGPHERTYQRKRWRITDYLQAVGVDLRKIKLLVVHGGRGVVAIPGPMLRKYGPDIRFDLTGNAWNKLRLFLPQDMPRNTSYDRYTAVSVFVNKPAPTVTDDDQLTLDGQYVGGIPYHGSPQRGGIRIYLDRKLALVIKRNALGDTGRVSAAGERERWNLGKLLAARGVDVHDVVAADVIYEEDRTRAPAVDLATFEFGTVEKVSGEIELLPTGGKAQEIILYRKGKVPPVWKRAPRERFPDGSVKEE
jgi:hypothetical protein